MQEQTRLHLSIHTMSMSAVKSLASAYGERLAQIWMQTKGNLLDLSLHAVLLEAHDTVEDELSRLFVLLRQALLGYGR